MSLNIVESLNKTSKECCHESLIQWFRAQEPGLGVKIHDTKPGTHLREDLGMRAGPIGDVLCINYTLNMPNDCHWHYPLSVSLPESWLTAMSDPTDPTDPVIG